MPSITDTDIIDVLRNQHDEAKGNLKSLVDADPDTRGSDFANLAEVLAAHEHGEESIVYPAILGLTNAGDVVADRQAEEAAASRKIAELKSLDPHSDEFAEGLEELKSAVEAHAGNEEAEVFPLLQTLDATKRSELGAAMLEATGA